MADGDEPTFTAPTTQEEFDRMIGPRLERERAKFPDYDTLKDKAGKFDELDAASKTELERLQGELADKDKALADLPKTVRAQAIRFASTATSMGFLDPEDALVFLPGDLDLADNDAVKAALEELKERKPHLTRPDKAGPKVQERPKPKAGDGNGSHGGDEPTGKERAAAALREFRKQ